MARRVLGDGLRRSADDHLPSGVAAFRAEVDHVVGVLDDVEVVFDDQDRVAVVDELVEGVEQLPDVVEVKAGRRLVEDVERLVGVTPAEMARQLDPLRLPAGERRGRLTERQVPEADVLEDLELVRDRRLPLEEVGRFVDGHLEDVGDVLALVGDVEHLFLVAFAAAGLALEIEIGQKLHLDLHHALALALLAAPPRHVEAEEAGFVAVDLRRPRLTEELADAVERVGIGGGVRARRPPDRLLVDHLHRVDVAVAADGVVLADFPVAASPLQALQALVERLVGEGRLAGAAHARHAHDHAEGDVDVDVLEVVLPGVLDREDAFAVDRAALGGNVDLLPPAQVLPGERVVALEGFVVGALKRDAPAKRARARAQVDDLIGRLHRRGVVLDDENGVAEVAEALQNADEPVVVARVQADRRLVENVERSHERRAERCRQVDPLRLPAGERLRKAVEREVVEADVDEVAAALPELVHHAAGDLLLVFVQLEVLEKIARLSRRHRTDLADVPPSGRRTVAVLVADLDVERVVAQAVAVALGTRRVAAEAGAEDAVVRLVGSLVQKVEEPADADVVLVAVPHDVALPVFELPIRTVDVHPGVGRRLDERLEVLRPFVRAERRDGALLDRELFVGNDEIGIEARHAAEALALGTRAHRAVEAEHERGRLLEAHAIPLEEVAELQPLGDGPLARDGLDRAPPLAFLERLLDGVGDPVARVFIARLHLEAVDEDEEAAAAVVVDRTRLGVVQVEDLGPLSALGLVFGWEQHDAEESPLAEAFELVAEGDAAMLGHRKAEVEASAVVERVFDLEGHASGRVLRDRPAADGRDRCPDAREEEPEVVVDLRLRRNGRSRVLPRGLLLDRDGRRQPRDEVGIRLVHPLEELPGVGRQTFDVASLPLRVDRVEAERRLARPRRPGEHDQPFTWKVEVDIL